MTIQRGEVLIKQGDAGESIFILLDAAKTWATHEEKIEFSLSAGKGQIQNFIVFECAFIAV